MEISLENLYGGKLSLWAVRGVVWHGVLKKGTISLLNYIIIITKTQSIHTRS